MSKKKEYEEWWPIRGYEGWYEVSTLGRVRSVDRYIYYKNSDLWVFHKGKVLKFRYHNGYAMVNLNKNKKMKEWYVHRLVIETFCSVHLKKKSWVNHKNGKKWDNRLVNLEWCTPSENNIHAVKHGLRHDNISGILAHNVKMRKPMAAFLRRRKIAEASHATELANLLMELEPERFRGVSKDSLPRAFNKAAHNGKEYHGLRFKFV